VLVVLGVVGYSMIWLVSAWIVLLGPAALILMKPTAWCEPALTTGFPGRRGVPSRWSTRRRRTWAPECASISWLRTVLVKRRDDRRLTAESARL